MKSEMLQGVKCYESSWVITRIRGSLEEDRRQYIKIYFYFGLIVDKKWLSFTNKPITRIIQPATLKSTLSKIDLEITWREASAQVLRNFGLVPFELTKMLLEESLRLETSSTPVVSSP